MSGTTKQFLALTAKDLMSRDLVTIQPDMSLRAAARVLCQAQISGAPVVDAQGRCVGVLSAADFIRAVKNRGEITAATPSQRPRTCPFWVRQQDPHGAEIFLCTLPLGVCPFQATQKVLDGQEAVICREPFSVPTNWQIVELEELPAAEVRHYMTADPVTVPPDTPINVLARMMLDAHIHRIIVVDEEGRPIGVVSSTDILAAVAYAR